MMNALRRKAKQLGRSTAKQVARRLAHWDVVWPFVGLYQQVIEEVPPVSGQVPSNKPTLLALNPIRFRSDLQILANTEEFRILRLPFYWQNRPLNLFWPNGFWDDYTKRDYWGPGSDATLREIQVELRSFLARFLTALYDTLGVDAVLSAGIHYKPDYDWGLVSDRIGTPWIVLHRENLATRPGHEEFHQERVESMGSFRGSHVFVHNEVMRDIFVRSGFAEPGEVSSFGCLRMDRFIERIQEQEGPREGNRSRVTLFSFNHCAGLFSFLNAWSPDGELGFVNLFDDVHGAVAELAHENPGIEFVIKTKWGDNWMEHLEDAFGRAGIESDTLENLIVTPDWDPHDLILGSDVVVGFGSTTLLESAVAGKPVIFPFFDEACKDDYADYVHFLDERQIFDVAESPKEMKRRVLERLKDSDIGEETMAERRRLFEKYVSTLEGDATEKYVKKIQEVLDENGE